MAPKSEQIGTVEGKTRTSLPVDVFASVGPKRRQVTLSGRDGTIDLDLTMIDQMQAMLDLAKGWLAKAA